jgi:adenylosuccinate synthase
MEVNIVLGLGFGDEGKGNITNALSKKYAPDNTLVVRFGGGHQVGHGVVLSSGLHHTYSNFGSGTENSVDTFWSKYCTYDPVGAMNELKLLKEKSKRNLGKTILDPEVMIVTPYDIAYNHYIEGINHHGSVGVGFGATVQRNEAHYHLYARDLRHHSVYLPKLQLISNYYKDKMDEEHFDSVSISEFIKAVEGIDDIRIRTFREVMSGRKVKHLLFEGHQGIMLDQTYGFFPHVTRSNTTMQNAIEMLREYYPEHDKSDIIQFSIRYVMRAYQTRHGNGPMYAEVDDFDFVNESKEPILEGLQGKFRYGKHSIDTLKYAIKCNRYHKPSFIKVHSEIVYVTCLDQTHDMIIGLNNKPAADLMNYIDIPIIKVRTAAFEM